MRLVDNHSESLPGCVDPYALPLLGERPHCLRDEGELLDRADDYGRPAGERLGELLRVLVDLLDDACLVLELVDGVLQLLVKHAPVGDHDDGVEDLLVLGVVEACKPVGKPRDRVGLARSGRVLDEVVAPGSMRLRVPDQPPHGVELW